MFLPNRAFIWPPPQLQARWAFFSSVFFTALLTPPPQCLSLPYLLLSVWSAHCFSPFQHWRLYEGPSYLWLWLPVSPVPSVGLMNASVNSFSLGDLLSPLESITSLVTDSIMVIRIMTIIILTRSRSPIKPPGSLPARFCSLRFKRIAFSTAYTHCSISDFASSSSSNGGLCPPPLEPSRHTSLSWPKNMTERMPCDFWSQSLEQYSFT